MKQAFCFLFDISVIVTGFEIIEKISESATIIALCALVCSKPVQHMLPYILVHGGVEASLSPGKRSPLNTRNIYP
jgi:hypothetical protein